MSLCIKTETKPNITGEEPAVLKKLVDSGKLPSKAAIRLPVILNRAGGKTLESVSDFLSVSLSSVVRYIKRFNPLGFNSPPLGGGWNWGCGGFVPPHTQRFQGEILNTPPLCGGDFLFQTGWNPC
jgi:hypothetical protein